MPDERPGTSRPSWRQLAHLAWTSTLAGCMSTFQQPSVAYRVGDESAPLGALGRVEVRRPAGPAAPRPIDRYGNTPRPRLDPGQDRAAPAERVDVGRLPDRPRIEPGEVTVEKRLTLEVAAPRRKQVGSNATFRVTLRNAADLPAEKIMLRGDFDDGLAFAGSETRQVERQIDRLAPGEVKELLLSLLGQTSGAHCCRFTAAHVSADGGEAEAARASACVEFAARQLDIDLIGPAERTEGSRAEFNIVLANRSIRRLTNVRAFVSFDQVLVPKEATSGRRQNDSSLSWELGNLEPMQLVPLQVEFECRSPARRACVNVEVRCDEITEESAEACLEITSVPGTLDLRASDGIDPLDVGQTGVFEAAVHNLGLQVARQVALEVELPPNATFVSAEARLGTEAFALKSELTERRLVFSPLDQLPPNERFTVLVRFEARTAGVAMFRASLTSSLSQTPQTAAEPTLVTEP